jgi:phosphopantothenoylcysteine synthetase/decarboxylase
MIGAMTESTPSTFGGRLLVGASGSAGVAFLPMFLSALRGEFTGIVTVLMTHTATRFLPASTMALFAERVVSGDDAASWAGDNHVSLADGHDLLVVLPTTANLLSAVAAGAAPNLLSATVLEFASPSVFYPVMSGQMWAKPSVLRNVEQLRADGHDVIDPGTGPRYDVSLRRFVTGPTPPAPSQFVERVRAGLTSR